MKKVVIVTLKLVLRSWRLLDEALTLSKLFTGALKEDREVDLLDIKYSYDIIKIFVFLILTAKQ